MEDSKIRINQRDSDSNDWKVTTLCNCASSPNAIETHMVRRKADTFLPLSSYCEMFHHLQNILPFPTVTYPNLSQKNCPHRNFSRFPTQSLRTFSPRWVMSLDHGKVHGKLSTEAWGNPHVWAIDELPSAYPHNCPGPRWLMVEACKGMARNAKGHTPRPAIKTRWVQMASGKWKGICHGWKVLKFVDWLRRQRCKKARRGATITMSSMTKLAPFPCRGFPPQPEV